MTLLSPLPARFLGAWERFGLTVDGDPVTDAGRAVWVEAGAAYVDVRGAGGFASDTCFAGTTSWNAPCLTWRHEIDAHPGEGGVDVGHITFDGDDLIEQGDFIAGKQVPYRERWRRLGGPLGPVLAADTADGAGLSVRVGNHAATVVDRTPAGGTLSARYQMWTGRRWVTEVAVGDGDDVGVLPGPLDSDAPLPPSWRWRYPLA
ncbi:MAG: hypothetical protein JOZ37_16985 [Actinobacteria bacterium]|nr:hypothetical protein [Actinomycetota bacterium]MBV9934227.1 hypothetical protein [Actinomycetota bacterium]